MPMALHAERGAVGGCSLGSGPRLSSSGHRWTRPAIEIHDATGFDVAPDAALLAAAALLVFCESSHSPGLIASGVQEAALGRLATTDADLPLLPHGHLRTSCDGLGMRGKGAFPGDLARVRAASRLARERADYLKGTVTGPGTLENTAMKSRSSGVR
jgi:hypothetical protein